MCLLPSFSRPYFSPASHQPWPAPWFWTAPPGLTLEELALPSELDLPLSNGTLGWWLVALLHSELASCSCIRLKLFWHLSENWRGKQICEWNSCKFHIDFDTWSIFSEVISGQERAALRYRTIQVLNRLLDITWQNPLVSFLIFVMTLAEAVALFILITSLARLPFPVLAFFTILGIDMLIAIQVLFKVVSYPYTTSCQFLELGKRQKRKSRWLVRFLRSCPPCKVSMGDGHFFDRKTSLVIWKSCIDMLVTFLLL